MQVDLDALDLLYNEGECNPQVFVSRAVFIWNAYPAIAAELREARKADRLKARAERAEHISDECAYQNAELRAALEGLREEVSAGCHPDAPVEELKDGIHFEPVVEADRVLALTPPAALDELRRKLIGEESDRWITAIRKIDLGLCDFIDEGDIAARLAEWLEALRRRERVEVLNQVMAELDGQFTKEQHSEARGAIWTALKTIGTLRADAIAAERDHIADAGKMVNHPGIPESSGGAR